MSKVYGQTLLDDMVRHQSLPLPLVKQAAKEILAVIQEGLIRDGVVNVSNFGTFRLKSVAARQGVNPQTREPLIIPAHQRVIFSPCKALRELIQPEYKPPVPIQPAVTPTRAVGSTTTTSMSSVASKRSLPSELQLPLPANEKTVEEASLAAVVEPNLNSEPLPPSAIDTVPEPAIAQIVKEQASESLAEPGVEQESNAAIALVSSQAENRHKTDSETISLEVGKLGEAEASRISSKRHSYLGAAAILVIAVVTSILLLDSKTDVKTTPAPRLAATKQFEAPTLIVHTTELKTEMAEIGAKTAADAQLPVVEVAGGENTPSPLYTEKPNPTPMEKPKTHSENNEGGASNDEGHVLPGRPTADESTSPVVSRASSFFFNEQTHKIAHGESLWRLARRLYQDPLLWPHIYQANTAIIDNPDHLRQGRTIVIPSLQGSPDKLSNTDRSSIAEGYYLTYLHYKKTGRKEAFFALLEAKRYDNKVVEKHLNLLQLSRVEEIMLNQQQTMPF